MTPSKEALSAAGKLSQRRMLYEWDGRIGHPGSASPLEAATIIDAAFSEHREQVRRLVEAASEADELPHSPCWPRTKVIRSTDNHTGMSTPDPGYHEDLNRLCMGAEWNAETQRWEKF